MGTEIKTTSVRLDTRLVDKAAKILGVKSRTEAVHIALREIVAMNEFKKMMTSFGGKLRFEGHWEQDPPVRNVGLHHPSTDRPAQ